MLNLGPGEIIFIVVAALLVLGPERLPELARGIGRFLAEFRRQTAEVRTVMEREFYQMDQALEAKPPAALPAEGGALQGGLAEEASSTPAPFGSADASLGPTPEALPAEVPQIAEAPRAEDDALSPREPIVGAISRERP